MTTIFEPSKNLLIVSHLPEFFDVPAVSNGIFTLHGDGTGTGTRTK